MKSLKLKANLFLLFLFFNKLYTFGNGPTVCSHVGSKEREQQMMIAGGNAVEMTALDFQIQNNLTRPPPGSEKTDVDERQQLLITAILD